jgi:SulP family sulfate permease
MFYATIIFILLVFFGQYARYIPYAVLAGILMVTAGGMVDTWSLKLIQQKSTLREMGIVVLVAGTTVVIDLITAVGLGVVITMLLFIRDQVTRSVVKNKFSGRELKSKKVRSADERAFLKIAGDEIMVYQLEGSIFFGTADGLQKEIERKKSSTKIFILDFKLVKDIDLTGAQILKQVDDILKDREKHLILSYVENPENPSDRRISRLLADVGVFDQIGEQKLFQDTDRALEWAEDHLIEEAQAHINQNARRINLKKMRIFQHLNDREMEEIYTILIHSRYKTGATVFQEGDDGDIMYILTRGSVSIFLDIGEGQFKKRITSFGSGVFFGEMALLEDKPRSATAIAEQETELYALKKKDFLKLMKTLPEIALKIQWGISEELASRLRSSNEEIRTLEMQDL